MRSLVLALENYRCSTMDEGEKRLAGMEAIIAAEFTARSQKIVDQRDAVIRAGTAVTGHPSFETLVVLSQVIRETQKNSHV